MYQKPKQSNLIGLSWEPRPPPAACSYWEDGVPKEASLSSKERIYDRWVYFPQLGESLKLNGLESVQAPVSVVDSFMNCIFLLLRSIWGYFAVMLYKNNQSAIHV